MPEPKAITADWLFRAAARYLERYASSEENLRRVLRRKAERRLAADEGAPDEDAAAACRALLEETVAKFVELKLVDDRGFAESKLRSLPRGGASARTGRATGRRGASATWPR